MYHSVIWKIMLLYDTGVHVAEFMSRWNLCLITIKFDNVVHGIKRMILRELIVTSVYFFSIFVVFAADIIPGIGHGFGIISITLFHSSVHEVRLSPSFVAFEFIGFFVHMYSVVSSRLYMLLVMTYSKVLENTARRWNLRLAYRLQKSGQFSNKKGYFSVNVTT